MNPSNPFDSQATAATFIKGAAAGLCLSAFQERPQQAHAARRVARRAVQAGAALCAGEAAAAAYRRADYRGVATALALGGLCVWAAEKLLQTEGNGTN